MHSGRIGSGSGQAHINHPQQQTQSQITRSSSNSSSSASPVSTAVSIQSAMLSAGQPSVASGIFRTGADNPPPSLRFAGSGSYVPAQYSSIYGIHSQSPGHATTLQPYSTFFPSFGGSSSAGHSFCHGTSMPGTSQGHYPQIESYSAMLASMGSRVQHHGAQGTDRTSRMQAPGVTASQHMNAFMSPQPILVASAGPYVSMQSSTRPHCSDSRSHTRSPSPGPSSTILSTGSTSSLQESLSSHHLDKLASRKGSLSLHARERDAHRELRLYGNATSLREDKLTLSPGSYSGSGHVPKVSFDSVVKEYGGGGDCLAGRGDIYTRTSLSGKEGSLKHRILVRPSDSDVPEELSPMTGVHGLKDEPSPKRPKMSGSISYSIHASLENPNDDQESDVHQLPKPHPASHRGVSKLNSVSCRRTEGSNHLDKTSHEYPVQQHVLYQQAGPDDRRTGNGLKQQQYETASTRSSASTSISSEDPSSNLQYPSHFLKGSIIQLANGTLKRVEDLKTEDFVNSAEISADLKVDSSTVVRIEEHLDDGTAMLSFCVGEHKVPVTVEATLEHPFFVFGQGWCSCSVTRTLARYGLDCQKLNVGDVCISLTHKDVSLKAAEISQQQQQEQSSTPEQHYKFTMTSSSDTSKRESPSPQNTSPSPVLAVSEGSSSISSSHEAERASNQSPASSVSTTTTKKHPSQTELPPPSSNIVLVKRENNNSHKRDFNRAAGELLQKEFSDEDESVTALRKKRQPVSEHSAAKAGHEWEKDKHVEGGVAQKNEEEIVRAGDSNNDHHG